MDFLYEPYFLSLLVAFICTGIYYLVQRNKNTDLEEEDSTKRKENLSPELKSILVFIISFSIFTGLFYAIKNYIYPKGNITIGGDSETSSIENEISIFDQMKNILPTMSLAVPSVPTFFEKDEEKMKEERRRERHEERRERRQIDETVIAGKKKSPVKENLKHMNITDARFADHDIDFDLNAFDLKGY